MIYGYARCSTNESKQNIKRQINELKSFGATDETIYLEYASGAKIDRVEFTKLLNIISSGDTLVTTEISRLSRSTQHLCQIIDIIKEKKIKLIVGYNMVVDCTNGTPDPITNAFLQMSGIFAELERNMIRERVKSGLENAKANGKILGRPQRTADNIPKIFLKNYPLYKDKTLNVTNFARLCGMSRTTIYKYINMIENKNN